MMLPMGAGVSFNVCRANGLDSVDGIFENRCVEIGL